jgi:uncharacterized protein (DUF779 family)
MKRIEVSKKCEDFVEWLSEKHGELIFHLSGGCCDGTNPMCFANNEFKVGASDVKIGEVAGFSFYVHKSQWEYFKYNKFFMDIREGRPSGFSLEVSYNTRFVLETKMISDEEYEALKKEERQEKSVEE